MCQTRPGPRCATDARKAIEAAQAEVDAAERELAEATAEYRATGAADAQRGNRYRITHEDPARQAASERFHAAQDPIHAARAALREAEREFKRTPTGQGEIEAEIKAAQEALETANEQQKRNLEYQIRDKERLLAELRAEREEQVVALKMVSTTAERLAAASPQEKQQIVEAEGQVVAAQAALDQAGAEHDAAKQALTDFEPVYANANAEYTAAMNNVRDKEAAVNEATGPVRQQLLRLYQEAGLPARNAGWYATDSIDNKRPRTRDIYGDAGRRADATKPVTGPVKVKIKRGADQAKCEAAAAAAETDEAFQAANARLKDTTTAHRAASIEANAVYDSRVKPLSEERRTLEARVNSAKKSVDESEKTLANAKDNHSRTVARVASGAGPDAHVVPVEQADIRRNPDGTINAWVYRAPSEGHPHGRYMRATGVTTVHGMGAANALVVEDGRKVYAHTHYSPGSGYGSVTSGRNSFNVLVVPAHPDARPLNEENLANAGWAIHTDSSG